MANRYKIYPEKNFAISIFEPGKKTIKEIYDLAQEIRNDKDFPSIHYHLTNLKGSSFEFEITEISLVIDLIKSYKKTDNQKVAVYMIDDPKQTATVHIFAKKLGADRNYCSTIEKAYTLLKIKIPFEEFLIMTKI